MNTVPVGDIPPRLVERPADFEGDGSLEALGEVGVEERVGQLLFVDVELGADVVAQLLQVHCDRLFSGSCQTQ
jgi:hypothetical protein